MKKYFFTLLLILNHFSTDLISQNKSIWIAFEDSTTGLYGFKDHKGNIQIEPKYFGFMLAPKFSSIVAVLEEHSDSYYLLKNGKIVGRDSVLMIDNGFDCESEGYIRFIDKKTNTTGMFNNEGKAVIPAKYNYLSKVRNGLIVALKGAIKVYPDYDSTDEHRGWTGGTLYLIDTADNILVKDFNDNGEIDFHSLSITETISADRDRINYPGMGGRYYTFINNKKLFENWLKNTFLKNLTKENISEHCYPKIIYWTEDSGWIAKASEFFLNDNFDLLKVRLSVLNSDSADFIISIDEFIITLTELESEFEKYLDNCGNLKTSQFPIMNVAINNRNETYQDNFSFLKTEKGFQLLNVAIRNALLK